MPPPFGTGYSAAMVRAYAWNRCARHGGFCDLCRIAAGDSALQAGVDTVPHQRAVRLAPGVDGYDIGVRLPAGPGRYVVTIEVSDGRRTARREVPLRVR